MTFVEYFNRGLDYLRENKPDLALKDFEEAIKLQPDDEDTQQMILQAKQMVDLKAKMIQSLLNEAQSRANIIGINLADVDKTIAEKTQMLKNDPNNASAKETLGYAYYISGLIFESKDDLAQAANAHSEAIKNIPDYIFAYKRRAGVNLEMNNFEQAINDYEKLIQTFPDDNKYKEMLTGVYSKRSAVCYGNGENDNAIMYAEMTLKLDPNNGTACEILRRLKTG